MENHNKLERSNVNLLPVWKGKLDSDGPPPCQGSKGADFGSKILHFEGYHAFVTLARNRHRLGSAASFFHCYYCISKYLLELDWKSLGKIRYWLAAPLVLRAFGKNENSGTRQSLENKVDSLPPP